MESASGRLYRVRRTVCQMLDARGYLVPQDDLKMSLDQFREKFGDDPSRDRMTMLVERKVQGGEQVIVFFIESDDPKKKIGIQPIKVIIDKMEAERIKNGILIVSSGITPYAKQIIAQMKADELYLELFRDTELLVNITEHFLVPKHQLLTADEKTQLLARYKLKETQLPRIQINDPVARFYGFKRGQVVKIVRPSETAGKYVTYRLCV